MVLVQGGRVLDPVSGRDEVADIVLENGRIQSIGQANPQAHYDEVLDARGLVVAPGLVDVHVHFRDPGLTYKEDMSSGSQAAARGGFTTVVCMANTKPVVDRCEALLMVLEKAEASPIRVHTIAAVSEGMQGKALTDLPALKKLGAVGFSDDGIPLVDSAFVRRAMLAVKELDAVLSLHEEDPALLGTPGINDGAVSAAHGFVGAPWVSESAMVARDCMLALDTGARVHMQHLSCAASVEAVRMAKALEARVTAEVTPQHFSLTEEAVSRLGTAAKLNPPLRTEQDRLALIAGLRDGTIDLIATDHAPHSQEEKSRPLSQAPSGMTGLETALSLGITNLVNKGHLTLPELLRKMTAAPAGLYGFDVGRLEEGAKADLVLFDEKERWTVSHFSSKSSNSPFVGDTLTGKVKYTLCRGKVVYRDGGQ